MDNNTKQNIYLVCKESEGIPDGDAIKQDELRVFNTHEAADEFAKFQRNTYVCDPNFADFTYMPDESKEGKNYAFAYNLAPDGMWCGARCNRNASCYRKRCCFSQPWTNNCGRRA